MTAPMGSGMGSAQMGVLFLFWLLMMAGTVVFCVIVLVALWRLMRAHESMAASVAAITQTLVSGRIAAVPGDNPPPPGPPQSP